MSVAELGVGVRDDVAVSSELEGRRAERPKRRKFSAEYDALTEPGAKARCSAARACTPRTSWTGGWLVTMGH
ncbi:hypothetical protein [Streptosporangium sp. NPDC087985]|uniref:hypothetical protein n=1 Tax=Streptosporangium sp. NPDC087985 TaxID=3366196 RepID=UPI0038154598